MRTVGYIPKEDMEQRKEPVTEQGGTATPPNSSNSSTPPETPTDTGSKEPTSDIHSSTPPETPTGGTGKKGRKKE